MRRMEMMEEVLKQLSKCLDIKICPYCRKASGKLCRVTIENTTRKKFQVACTNCGARGPMDNVFESAVSQYNEIADIIEKYDHLKS